MSDEEEIVGSDFVGSDDEDKTVEALELKLQKILQEKEKLEKQKKKEELLEKIKQAKAAVSDLQTTLGPTKSEIDNWSLYNLKNFFKEKGILIKNRSVEQLRALAKAILETKLENYKLVATSTTERISIQHNEKMLTFPLVTDYSLRSWYSDTSLLPAVDHISAHAYILSTADIDLDQFKNLRNEDGYILYKSNCVHDVKAHRLVEGHEYVKGCCWTSGNDKHNSDLVWSLINENGCVQSAGCSCTEDNGCCKHVIALLLTLASRNKSNKGTHQCTKGENKCTQTNDGPTFPLVKRTEDKPKLNVEEVETKQSFTQVKSDTDTQIKNTGLKGRSHKVDNSDESERSHEMDVWIAPTARNNKSNECEFNVTTEKIPVGHLNVGPNTKIASSEPDGLHNSKTKSTTKEKEEEIIISTQSKEYMLERKKPFSTDYRHYTYKDLGKETFVCQPVTPIEEKRKQPVEQKLELNLKVEQNLKEMTRLTPKVIPSPKSYITPDTPMSSVSHTQLTQTLKTDMATSNIQTSTTLPASGFSNFSIEDSGKKRTEPSLKSQMTPAAPTPISSVSNTQRTRKLNSEMPTSGIQISSMLPVSEFSKFSIDDSGQRRHEPSQMTTAAPTPMSSVSNTPITRKLNSEMSTSNIQVSPMFPASKVSKVSVNDSRQRTNDKSLTTLNSDGSVQRTNTNISETSISQFGRKTLPDDVIIYPHAAPLGQLQNQSNFPLNYTQSPASLPLKHQTKPLEYSAQPRLQQPSIQSSINISSFNTLPGSVHSLGIVYPNISPLYAPLVYPSSGNIPNVSADSTLTGNYLPECASVKDDDEIFGSAGAEHNISKPKISRKDRFTSPMRTKQTAHNVMQPAPRQKITYDKKFLLKLRRSPFSKRKPDLAHIPEIIADVEIDTPFEASLSIAHTQGYVKGQKPMASGKKRNPSPKPKAVASTDELNTIPKAVPIGVKDSKPMTTEDVMRTTIGAFNMLKNGTDSAIVLKMISELHISTDDALIRIVSLVVETAVDEPRFTSVCSSICRILAKVKVESRSRSDESITFSTAYRQKCEKEIEQGILSRSNEAYKRRVEEIVRFTASIARLMLLKVSDIHHILMKLCNTGSEHCLECFCVLLTDVWDRMEQCTSTNFLDQYYEIIDEADQREDLSASLKHKLSQIQSKRRRR